MAHTITNPLFQIEEQVPVLVCTRTRLDNSAVFLQRGQVFRKEGEKRRRKTGEWNITILFTFNVQVENQKRRINLKMINKTCNSVY